jgi:hypothetical protein
VAGAAVLAEVHRAAAHPLGPRIPRLPVQPRRPRILEMQRERRKHSLLIRVAAAGDAVDAVAAVRPAERRPALPALRLKAPTASPRLQKLGYSIDRREASRGLRRRAAIRTANRAQMRNAEIAGALEHRQAVVDEQGPLQRELFALA